MRPPALLALQGCALLKAERMQLALVVSLGGGGSSRQTNTTPNWGLLSRVAHDSTFD